MFIAVDLPEPLGPMTRDELAGAHLKADAGERVHRRLAAAIRPHDVVECDDCGGHGDLRRRREIDDHRRARREISAPQHRHFAVGRTERHLNGFGLIAEQPPHARLSVFSGSIATLQARRPRQQPEASTAARSCLCRGRRESQRRVRDEDRLGHLCDDDVRRRRHAGLQEALGVVDPQDRLVKSRLRSTFSVCCAPR